MTLNREITLTAGATPQTPPVDTLDLLYIHPEHRSFGKNDIIPMGAIGLMNSVSCGKLGVMQAEASDALIGRSRIIAMDLHWYLSLFSVEQTIKRIRRVNPGASIVIGGYTATVFADLVVHEFGADYVIRGDAEEPFRQLVERLLNGESARGVPNVTAKEFTEPLSFTLTTDVYDSMDYLTIDWFPSLEKKVFRYQKNKYPVTVYPFIPCFKGCVHACENCYGSPRYQKRVCGRGFVARSPERVRRDLETCSRDPRIRTVYMIMDFMDYPGAAYSDIVFSQKYDLNLYFEFFNVPPVSELDKALGSFNRCFFYFPLVPNHVGDKGSADFEGLRRILEHRKKKDFSAVLWVNPELARRNPSYRDGVLDLRRRHGVDLMNGLAELISIPSPFEENQGLARELRVFYTKSKNKTFSGALIRALLPVIFKSSLMLRFSRWAYTLWFTSLLMMMKGEPRQTVSPLEKSP